MRRGIKWAWLSVQSNTRTPSDGPSDLPHGADLVHTVTAELSVSRLTTELILSLLVKRVATSASGAALVLTVPRDTPGEGSGEGHQNKSTEGEKKTHLDGHRNTSRWSQKHI